MVTDNHDSPPVSPGEAPDPDFSAAAAEGNDVVHAPRVVIGDRGAGWIVESWDGFRAAAGQWLALCVVGLVIMIVIEYIPGVSLINSMLLKPVWIAGLMLACQAQRQGKPVEVKHLFAGFSNKAGALIVCGLLEALISGALIVVLLGPVLIDIFKAMFPGGAAPTLLDMVNFNVDIEDRTTLTRVMNAIDLYSLLIRILILLALLIPVWAATWFAPALIVLGGKTVKEALLLSLVGALKNTWPFLIYGLCGLLLCLLIPITLGLALLALAPMMYISIYLSYRDIYLD
ncbi:MAG TPA: BPSS1780 family membrane protein [Candidatus Acidoferrum sp.]|nr:BPSS1780 family membrane protein [Candidatus Acidoferrum sp.]